MFCVSSLSPRHLPIGMCVLAFETAQAFWKLLLPHGMTRGALTRKSDGEDVDMSGEGGWEERYTQWWFDFLTEKGARGVSKDVWVMVRPLCVVSVTFLCLIYILSWFIIVSRIRSQHRFAFLKLRH